MEGGRRGQVACTLRTQISWWREQRRGRWPCRVHVRACVRACAQERDWRWSQNNHATRPANMPRCHFFNTFFLNKLYKVRFSGRGVEASAPEGSHPQPAASAPGWPARSSSDAHALSWEARVRHPPYCWLSPFSRAAQGDACTLSFAAPAETHASSPTLPGLAQDKGVYMYKEVQRWTRKPKLTSYGQVRARAHGATRHWRGAAGPVWSVGRRDAHHPPPALRRCEPRP